MPSRGETRSPIILGRRNCERCTGWKLAVEFRWRWKKVQGRLKDKTLDGRTTQPHIDLVCIECRKKEDKARYANLDARKKAKKIKEDAERKRVWQEGATEIRAVKARLAEKEAELERKAAKLDRLIANTRLVIPPQARTHNGEKLKPLLPFRLWLLRYMYDTKKSIKQLADELRRDEQEIRRWSTGVYWPSAGNPQPVHQIALSNVDYVITRTGFGPDVLNELYPWTEEDDDELEGRSHA